MLYLFLQIVIHKNIQYYILIVIGIIETTIKHLNKIKGAKIVKALLEDQQPNIEQQIKAVPVIFIYKDRSLVGEWDEYFINKSTCRRITGSHEQQ